MPLNRQLPDLLQACYKCLDVKGEKFAYAVLKNKNKIKSKLEKIWEKYPISVQYGLYDTQRDELAKKYSKKDEEGNPVVKGEKYVIENKEEFEKELEKLKETHKDAIKEREQQIADYQKELDEESDIEIHMVSEVPEGISARELEAADFMIQKQK